MRGRRKFLFATRNDLEPGIRAFEAKRAVKYMLEYSPEIGLFETYPTEVYYSLLDVPDLGIAKYGRSPGDRYLIMDASTEVLVREIPQRRGGVRYDLEADPISLLFSPGGIYQESALIVGELWPCSDEPAAIELYRLFAREVTRGFTVVGRIYRCGPEAIQFARTGIRLTHDVRSPIEYDIPKELLPPI